MKAKQTLLELAEFMRERGVEIEIDSHCGDYSRPGELTIDFIINEAFFRGAEINLSQDCTNTVTPSDIEQAAKEMEE